MIDTVVNNDTTPENGSAAWKSRTHGSIARGLAWGTRGTVEVEFQKPLASTALVQPRHNLENLTKQTTDHQQHGSSQTIAPTSGRVDLAHTRTHKFITTCSCLSQKKPVTILNSLVENAHPPMIWSPVAATTELTPASIHNAKSSDLPCRHLREPDHGQCATSHCRVLVTWRVNKGVFICVCKQVEPHHGPCTNHHTQ